MKLQHEYLLWQHLKALYVAVKVSLNSPVRCADTPDFAEQCADLRKHR